MKRLGVRGRLGAVGALALLIVLGLRTFPHRGAQAAPSAGHEAIRVDAVAARRADVPVYLQGLGTVQAFYTVTVTARVDGQIERVAFTEGQNVKKGDLLVQIDPRPNQAAYDQAVAMRAKDAALLENARRDLARYAQLEPQNLASKQTVDTQRALIDQLGAQIKVDEAAIDSARTQLEYTRIVSPIDGRTGIRLIDPGNIVHATDTAGIVVVTQLHPISVVFTLPEEQLEAVARAQAAGPVKVLTVTRAGEDVLDEGTLALIDNEIDTTTGTMKLKATFANAHDRLWPGQYVDARVLIRIERDALVVPDAAVQTGPEGPFTFVVRPDSTVQIRPLELGEESGGETIVRKGLAPGERVVTRNQYRLQAGARVQVNAA